MELRAIAAGQTLPARGEGAVGFGKGHGWGGAARPGSDGEVTVWVDGEVTGVVGCGGRRGPRSDARDLVESLHEILGGELHPCGTLGDVTRRGSAQRRAVECGAGLRESGVGQSEDGFGTGCEGEGAGRCVDGAAVGGTPPAVHLAGLLGADDLAENRSRDRIPQAGIRQPLDASERGDLPHQEPRLGDGRQLVRAGVRGGRRAGGVVGAERPQQQTSGRPPVSEPGHALVVDKAYGVARTSGDPSGVVGGERGHVGVSWRLVRAALRVGGSIVSFPGGSVERTGPTPPRPGGAGPRGLVSAVRGGRAGRPPRGR